MSRGDQSIVWVQLSLDVDEEENLGCDRIPPEAGTSSNRYSDRIH